MARQVLDNGIVLPSEYSDDWYDDMTSNLTKLDEVIGSDAEKLSASDVGAAAITNDYDDLDDKPAYNILRRASVTLTAGGTGNYSDLDSYSKIKAGDYVLDAANKLYSITAIDAANSTYTVSAAALFTVTDKAELGAAALSNDYDDLNNLPGYGILRFCSTAITNNSNVAFANISSVSKIAAGDFLLDTAGKLYQIASVDTVNETAAVTTPVTQLALDANVMHLSGNETAGGFKTFDGYIQCNGGYIGNEFSINARTELILRSNRDTDGQSGVCISKFRQNKAQGSMSGSDQVQVTFDVLENSVRTNRLWYFNLLGWENDVPKTVELRSMCDKVDYRLTHINDKNPGVLSFPNLSSGLDISGYITAGNTHNEYTPLVDGWVAIILKSTSGACAIYLYQSGICNAQYSNTTLPNEKNPCTMASIPVKAGTVVSIDIKGSNNYVYSAKFYPNLGNV